jgi:ABC-2 type transport system permease protein
VSSVPVSSGRWEAFREDTAKFGAFFRRDLLVLWSYRTAFLSDWVNMIVQVLVFYFVNQLIPPARLPRFGGQPTTYIEFVTVAITLTAFIQISLGRVVTAIRQEQALGTLEALLVTPTAPSALQLGSVVYDLLYIPLRTAVFLTLMAVLLDVHLSVSGIAPTAVLFLVFIPFVWGLGVTGAAAVLTFKRGSTALGVATAILTLFSGAYIPIQYFPPWLETVARYNPITTVLSAARESLLGDADWSIIWPAVFRLLPLAAVSLSVGMVAFRLALARERRKGTLGLY